MKTSLRWMFAVAGWLVCLAGPSAAQSPAQAAPPQAPVASKPAPPAATAPKEAAPIVRYLIGGDSRDDHSKVIQWAFREAKARSVTAFIFLGDMELTPELDEHFEHLLSQLDPVPFYPVLGNHEVLRFGRFPLGEAAAAENYRKHFLGTPRTPVQSTIKDRMVYSADLPGGLHFVALDNVSQHGFGAAQMAWLSADLEECRRNPATRYVIVGMHKPLARNGITSHSMEEDGLEAISDSDLALALFQKHNVSMIVASHLHEYDEFKQGGIASYITGGMGAPVTHNGPNRSFHHLLQVEVDDSLHASVVRFGGAPSEAGTHPDD